MAATRIFTPKNRLAGIIGDSQDPTAEALQARAEARVESLKEDIEQFLAQRVATIERIATEREDILFAECLALGEAALSVCEVAGSAGHKTLGEVARGIHAMVDALVTQGVWHTEALQAHMNALAVVAANPETPVEDVGKMLARLKAMRDRIGVQD
jgi:hypothetical protein